MPLRVRPTRLAAKQIRAEARWWRMNRPSAPALFRDEVRRAFDLVAEHPEIGAVAEDIEIAAVRRVLLAASGHYLYYAINETEGNIDVLAIWSTRRGKEPRLKPSSNSRATENEPVPNESRVRYSTRR